MTLKNRDLWINLLLGLGLLSIPILTSPDFGSGGNLFRVPPFQRNFLGYLLLMVFFYVHYYALIPGLYMRKKWWAYAAILAVSLALISYLPSAVISTGPDMFMPEPPPPGLMREKQPLLDLFSLRDTFVIQFFMVLALSFLLRLDHELKSVKNEKLKTEVSYLKAQINPHFLFNTLNSIYALSLTKSDKAPDAILKLSDMMRYVVLESDTENVPMERELNYIADYIALQQLRIGKNVGLEFKIKGDPEGKEIAPIILINYVENAFKYGVNPDESSKIAIFITIEEQGVRLQVENKITVDKTSLPPNTEEGNINTKKRLDYRYPGKYRLSVSESGKTYKVELFITLT